MAPMTIITFDMPISKLLLIPWYMISNVTTTPNPNDGMNKVPPNLGMLYLCTFRVLGRSNSSCVLHILTIMGVHISEKIKLMAKAIMIYV